MIKFEYLNCPPMSIHIPSMLTKKCLQQHYEAVLSLVSQSPAMFIQIHIIINNV